MVYFKELGNLGRLCNQFFEIAATTSVAIENDDQAVFSFWEYNDYLKNGIKTDEMKNFNIYYDYVNYDMRYCKIPYIKNMNLTGYFQSEKYFYNCKNEIREIFTLKEELENNLKDKWKDVLKNSVSIHVRRTDYLVSQNENGIHICPTMNYFDISLKYIDSIVKIDNILVFSDDIEWCKNNFNDSRCIFVEDQKDIEDLFLMSYCDHNITTNSTFSWWASWLNRNENKIITIPKQWFNMPKDFYIDLYREDMIVFDN